jgi:hypothetical protein
MSLWVKSRHDRQPMPTPTLPPKEDIDATQTDVCFVPKADIGNTEFGVEAGTEFALTLTDYDRNTGGDQPVFGYLRGQIRLHLVRARTRAPFGCQTFFSLLR